MTRPIVVSDAGPLIALAGCGQLELLVTIFGVVHIPKAVLDETTADQSRRGAADIADFGRQHATIHANRSDAIYNAAVSHLDEGEAQALSLAQALGCGLLMDERRGRQEAQRQGLPLFGVLGVLLQAKRLGKVVAVAPLLDKMQQNGYRISTDLIAAVLAVAGENS